MKTTLSLLLLLLANECLAAPTYTYRVVAKYPHATASYTEGFFFLNGLFYEGTGISGHSQLLAIEPASGRVVQHADLDAKYFGEGIVDAGPNILEWTWQTHTGFVIDRFSFRTLREFHYTGEGWGMTRVGKQIVSSDGTSTLRFRNADTFAEVRHVVVKDGAKEVDQLNDLEYVKGEIYANVWHTDRIARISPKTGKVLGWIDLSGLEPESSRSNPEAVLNGIAYDAKGDRLFVTGKQWPAVFEIKVLPPAR